MSASGKAGWDRLFEPKVPGFPKAQLNDLGSVERLIGDRTVAVMLEPIQGEAGVLMATDAFLRGLRELTAARGVLLIADEIQTGMGRTGKLFGYEHAGIEPDIMTLGKGIGGGVPLAALLAKERVCCFEHGDQGGTYNGNPLMTAVGCAVLDALLAPGFLESVAARGEQLAAGLRKLARQHSLGEVRGRGLLMALDLGRDVGGKVVDAAREAGLLVNSPRPASLRFMPALTTAAGEIDEMLATLDGVLAKVLPG
jgi:acetylornithine/N-succinyldiaminopimelate aminotransferase